MAETAKSSIETVSAYFRALELRDKDALVPLLSSDVVEVIPFSIAGGSAPFAEFKGREAVLGYVSRIFENFSRTVLVDKSFHATEDGRVVFVEAKGDLVSARTSAPYRNVYVFKFELEGGKIVHITEYANPVTFAKAMGMPVG